MTTTEHEGETNGERSSEPASGPLGEGVMIAERWVVVREIGRGSSGTVYLAHEGGNPTAEVALKVIHRERCGDRQVIGRFRREAKILGKLDARHVVPVLACTEHDGLVVLVLELARGASLEAILVERGGGLSTTEAVEIARQLGEALAAAHDAGVVHRDLKPANVVIEEEATTKRVRILDFGLAKAIVADHQMTAITDHGMIFGTPEYMAPEQVRGDEFDGRSDLYSLGIVLYEMLAGRVPFDERTAIATMTAHLSQPVPPLRERGSSAPSGGKPPTSSEVPKSSGESVSRALEAVVMRALAKDPNERWPDARAFVDALTAAQDERRVVSRASADAMELGETIPANGAGALRRSQIMRAAAEHAKGREASSSRATLPSAEAAPKPRAAAAAPPTAPSGGTRPTWIAVAIALAILCAVLGAAFGAR